MSPLRMALPSVDMSLSRLAEEQLNAIRLEEETAAAAAAAAVQQEAAAPEPSAAVVVPVEEPAMVVAPDVEDEVTQEEWEA